MTSSLSCENRQLVTYAKVVEVGMLKICTTLDASKLKNIKINALLQTSHLKLFLNMITVLHWLACSYSNFFLFVIIFFSHSDKNGRLIFRQTICGVFHAASIVSILF